MTTIQHPTPTAALPTLDQMPVISQQAEMILLATHHVEMGVFQIDPTPTTDMRDHLFFACNASETTRMYVSIGRVGTYLLPGQRIVFSHNEGIIHSAGGGFPCPINLDRPTTLRAISALQRIIGGDLSYVSYIPALERDHFTLTEPQEVTEDAQA